MIIRIALPSSTRLSHIGFASPLQHANLRALEVTDEQIEESIEEALAYLAGQQASDGCWDGSSADTAAITGLAVLAFETRAIQLHVEPLSDDFVYKAVVEGGLTCIQGLLYSPAGSCDTEIEDTCLVLGPPYHVIYNTAIGLMAFAASGQPETHLDSAQALLNSLIWAQVDAAAGEPHMGGWRYFPNQSSTDNSNTGWVTLGLGYAQAGSPFGFDLVIPEALIELLDGWLDRIQVSSSGGSSYEPTVTYWVNILKTGNLLYEQALVGDAVEDDRVQNAIGYIQNKWNEDDGYNHPQDGWLNHCQATFTMVKGLEVFHVETLEVGGEEIDWFQEVAHHVVGRQLEDGSWATEVWVNTRVLTTSWCVLGLMKEIPTFIEYVPLDVKPRSCRNPFNPKAKGSIPMAVLGTEDFHVDQVDQDSIALYVGENTEATITPFRYHFGDEATPFEPFNEKPMDPFACTTEGADGYMDLTFKVDAVEFKSLLDNPSTDDMYKVFVKGNLMEEYGGTEFIGEDIIQIVGKN